MLKAPNFNQPFSLAVDASDHGAGAVLFQAHEQGVEHPVGYFSKKFNVHQIEKETLALVIAFTALQVVSLSLYTLITIP